MNGNQPRRGGAILICVLVCMGIVSTITLLAVRTSLQVRRQMRQEVQLEQTRWLLDAGLARGLQRLRDRPDYQGETWNVAPALSTYAEATVQIAILTDEPDQASASTTERRLQVTATIGAADGLAAPSPGSTSRTDSIFIPPLSSSSDNG